MEGFSTNTEPDDKVAIALFGKEGSGKTRFCCTAPDPIGFIPLDRKTRRTVNSINKELGKQIYMPDDDFVRVSNPMKLATLKDSCGSSMPTKSPGGHLCCAKHYYRQHVNAVKQAAFTLYEHPSIRTIIIDTGTQLWEDMLFAEFGRSQRIMPRDRGAVNQEMIDLLNCLSGKNLIITHKAKEVWKNDHPTGKFEVAGFPHIGYHVNAMVEMAVDAKKKAEDQGRFNLNVHLCQSNPDIQGPNGTGLLQDDAISFPMLALAMFPDSEAEEWM